MSEEFPSPAEIRALAEDYGYIERRDSVSCTLFFKAATINSEPHPTLINVFYTTRGVMTQLSHPNQGYNAMWRTDAYDSLEMLAELFENPRTHTGKGYRQAKDAMRGCCNCGWQKKKGRYSLNQWRLGPGKAICLDCMEGKGNNSDEPKNGKSDTKNGKSAEEKPITNLEEVMKNSKQTMERRQFNCPLCPQQGRGKNVFFKRVPADRPIVKCYKCKKVKDGDCDRLYPIPRGEEKGYGFFRCNECNKTWGSSRSIANVGQQCYTCDIAGKPNNFVKPFRIEVPRPGKSRGIAGGGTRPAGRGMRRVPRESIPEDEPESAQYSATDGDRFNNSNGNGGFGGRSTGIGRSFDFVPTNGDNESASGSMASSTTPSVQPKKFVHKCEGCATGLCRSRKLPISGIHDSTGDTMSTSRSVTTNSRIDDRDFRDMDEDFDDWADDDGSVYVSAGFNGKVLRN